MRRTTWALAAAATVTAASLADAGVIINQGFENTTAFPAGTALTVSTGDVIGKDAGIGGEWYASAAPATNYPTARTTPVHSGSQSLEISVASPSTHTFGRSNLTGMATGTVEMQLYFYRPTAASGFTTSAAFQSSLYVTNIPTAYIIPDGRFAVWNSVDKDPANPSVNGAGYQTLDINGAGAGNGATALNTWYGIRLVIDLDAKTYDTFLDAGSGFAQVGTATPYTNNPGVVNTILFAPQGGTSYVDDVTLIVPEPASLGLLGFASLLALRRRSRT